MDLPIPCAKSTEQNTTILDALSVSAQEVSERTELIKKTMGNSDIIPDSDIATDLSVLEDMEILSTCPETGLFSNSNVMDCLPELPSNSEFGLSPINSGDETALCIHGPLHHMDSEVSLAADTLDQNAIAGVCGLRNLGNTCFMNAGLQCLFNNKAFLKFFWENDVEQYMKNFLTNKFVEIMKKVWSAQYSVINLSDFKEMIGETYHQFKDYRQHDCQEFLALLLDAMHEQLNVAIKNSSQPDIYNLFESAASDNKTKCVGLCYDTERESASEKCSFILKNEEIQKESHFNECYCDSVPRNPNVKASSDNLICSEINSTKTPNETNITVDTKLSKNVSICTERPCRFDDDTTICEKNTEKMADLLINNRNIDKLVNRNDLEESSLLMSESFSKKKLFDVQIGQGLSTQNLTCDNKLEKNELAYKYNATRKIPNFGDFVKDTKTLNTNVLVPDEANNLLKFDSEKFPKTEKNRLRETVDNLGEMLEFDNKHNSLKRMKVTNLFQEQNELSESDSTPSKLDICVSKRIKIEDTKCLSKCIDTFPSEIDEAMELEQIHEDFSEESSQSCEINIPSAEQCVLSADEELKANTEWEKYKTANQSIIVDTFHGQFRSSVICSKCSHVSITYEPFMYLPVPLPHAMERQIVVTYMQDKGKSPIRYLVNVRKHDRVKKIKDTLLELLDDRPNEIILAEVFQNHISKFLDDNTLVRHVNDISRAVYAFEVIQYAKQNEALNEPAVKGHHTDDLESGDNLGKDSGHNTNPWGDTTSTLPQKRSVVSVENQKQNQTPSASSTNVISLAISSCDNVPRSSSKNIAGNLDISHSGVKDIEEGCPLEHSEKSDDLTSSNTVDTVQWHSCAICLEELPDYNLMLHPSCQCVLCNGCIEVSCKHYGGDSFICPVCSASVSPLADFVPVNSIADFKFKISMIPIPIVIRHDLFQDETLLYKNLVGHPRLLKLPTSLSAAELYECVDKAIPFLSTYSLLLVDGQGKNCSRCLYTQHCSGCEIAHMGDVKLQPGDSLAVRYLDLSHECLEMSAYVTDHRSMQQKRHKSILSLYDCMEAFSERENLDENSPWYCPVCCQNQQAMKSLSVWRFPDILIVCLKRFVFHDYTSVKLEEKVVFPLDGLNLSNFTSGPISDDLIYDLQACVCHFGSLSSGHYTSYVKHAIANEWYYFNDESVSKQAPKTDDCVDEYILFYQKR